MKASEKKYMNRVAELGCAICGSTPANLHHPRFASGMSQRSPNFLVIPLCKWHHQDGPHGVAIHNGQIDFEKNFGTEAELLAQTIEKVMK